VTKGERLCDEWVSFVGDGAGPTSPASARLGSAGWVSADQTWLAGVAMASDVGLQRNESNACSTL
jgi:hypothetical protein